MTIISTLFNITVFIIGVGLIVAITWPVILGSWTLIVKIFSHRHGHVKHTQSDPGGAPQTVTTPASAAHDEENEHLGQLALKRYDNIADRRHLLMSENPDDLTDVQHVLLGDHELLDDFLDSESRARGLIDDYRRGYGVSERELMAGVIDAEAAWNNAYHQDSTYAARHNLEADHADKRIDKYRSGKYRTS